MSKQGDRLPLTDYLTPFAIDAFKSLDGKRLIEAFLPPLVPGMKFVDQKKEALIDINIELDTKYDITHFNNWYAGRKTTPTRVANYMRLHILQYALGDEAANILYNLLFDE